MKTYTVQPPNTCGLVFSGDMIGFICAPGKVSFASDNSSLEEFTSLDAAAARAKELNSDYDLNCIYGELILTPSVETIVAKASFGDSVTLSVDVTSDQDGTISSYVWSDADTNKVLGTTKELTLSSISSDDYRAYKLTAKATNERGQSGELVVYGEIITP